MWQADMSLKMQTTRTWIERPYEASLFPGISFGLFQRSLGPTGQGIVSGRQFLWGIGLSKGNEGVQSTADTERGSLSLWGSSDRSFKNSREGHDETSRLSLRYLSSGSVVMRREQHQSIPNMVVKLYYSDGTVEEVLGQNSSTPG
ncbi:hypothetical protein Gogos_021877 [Gossypium gossypioides]|uniref:Uncharacterized protein n=1 Tax=Gossypium gossypioides TaxID=34282 RepID=A0A7J9CZE6_GOSGO|nr:hypothetical protein [Gossypium gossypioides]